MKTEGARTLPAQVQEEKRKQAIRLYKRDHQYKEIASIVGVHFETVGKWVRAYRSQGREGIISKKHGRKLGSGRALNTEQSQSIQRLIIDKRPDQLKMTYALWKGVETASL